MILSTSPYLKSKMERFSKKGQKNLPKNFRNNKPILEFKEDMIESRQSSLVEKVLVQGAKKTAVRPSPNKKDN